MTQRNKNILLILGFALLLILSYRMAFSKTLASRNQVRALEEETTTFGNLSGLSATLNAREHFADSILQKNNIKSNSIQNNLLDVLNASAEERNFVISEFNEPHIYTENGVSVTSYRFTLKGAFNDMQQVLFDLEQRYNYGKVVHVNFNRKRDYRKRKDYLLCTVILESIMSRQN